MHTPSKKTLFLLSIGVLVISVAAVIFKLSLEAGLIITFGTALIQLFCSIPGLIHEMRDDLKTQVAQLREEIEQTQQELRTRAGLPLDAQYLKLQEDRCPLFKQAADEIYHEAADGFALLHRNELHIDNLEQVYRRLEFLFRDYGPLKDIKAVSSGEFGEWLATDSWWIKHYMQLHQLAYERGVQIERIFIVKSNSQAKTYDSVFQRNVKYHVRVKTALHGRISQADHQMGNCMLFYTERKEPVYALVAHHDHQGGCEHIVIYRDPQKIKHIVEAYERIASVAKPYPANNASEVDHLNKLVPMKSA